MKAYTDYPFTFLGDVEYQKAPMREINVLSYDGDKYCVITVAGIDTEIKLGYVYRNEKNLQRGRQKWLKTVMIELEKK